MSKGSYIYHANAPLLTTEWIVSNRRKFFKNNNLIENEFFPLKNNDFKNIPPTVVFAAECDPLSDDGKIYTQKLKLNNNNAKCFLEKGLVHSYIRAINVSKKANASFQKMLKELNHLAEGDWPH
jgi:acetyl esterase